jgi:aromatase
VLEAEEHVVHSITVAAPPSVVYQAVADATRWPQVFGPTVHLEQEDLGGGTERLHLWATANGEVRNWTSLRELDPEALRVSFRQEKPSAPVLAMGGQWRITATGDGSLVELTHDYRAADGDDSGLEWIARAVDRNSEAELASMKAAVEARVARAELEFSFSVTVEVDRDGAGVYDFLYRSDLWPQRLPHVAALKLTEERPGIQLMEMDTVANDGTVHTTTSARVCFPGERIVYKQLATPKLLAVHTGRWEFEKCGDGVAVTSRHTVVLDSDAIGPVLGADTTIADAKVAVVAALSGNSRITLEHAKAFAESEKDG